MKRKIATRVIELLAYGAMLASVILAIVMLVNFYKWFNFTIEYPQTMTIITPELQEAIQTRQQYQATALTMIEPVCYTLFSGFALLITALILKLQPKQTQVK